jgi:UDP-GlcNAc:undecaprenyl-phosphate GlcNAc-1-phosphate transferase
MPGYGGGALAGYLLAVLSILSWAKLGTLFLVLSMPLVDAFYVILRRLKDLKSPFKGDAGHFHHRLLTIGWGKTRIALFYWFVSLLFGVSSLYLQGVEKIFALILVSVSLALFIVVINRIKSLRNSSR